LYQLVCTFTASVVAASVVAASCAGGPGLADSPSPVLVLARVEARPDQRDAVAELTDALVQQSRAEPGAIAFDVFEQRDRPGRFFFYEVFRSPAAARRHREADHTRRWFADVGPLLVSPPQIWTPPSP